MKTLWIGALMFIGALTLAGPPNTESAPETVQNTRPVVAPIPSTSVAPAPTQAPIVTTTTIPPLVGPDTPCQEWVPTALGAGWPADRDIMETLVSIMWRESRCDPTVHNADDPNSGSYGLVQINTFWCEPNQRTTNGWLQDNGILDDCLELADPATNLRAAWAIYTYSVDKNHGNGWHPWRQ